MADQEADVTPEGQVDDEENGDIDAGYTYAGQMIDHDLTLDNRPNDLTTPVDPRTLPNARTPAFDLDSVYGGGPAGSPQLYAADRMHLLLGAPAHGNAQRPRVRGHAAGPGERPGPVRRPPRRREPHRRGPAHDHAALPQRVG